MNTADFRERAGQASDVESIDELCLEWLKEKANDYGRDGVIAKELLKLFERLTT